MTTDAPAATPPVDVRIIISALWTSMLFVFAYIDIFGLFRADVRADIAAGEVSGFTIGQPFLLGTTLYILVPALMVPATLVLRPRVNRIANTAAASVYAVTIVAGAVGEWAYYIVASVVEVALLVAVVRLARRI